MSAPSSFSATTPLSLASDSTTAHARPVKPPLTSMASTPGLEIPGGYPRTSTVFAGNKWDHRNGNASGEGLLAAAKTYLPAGAKAKKFLPEAVAGYFPSTSDGAFPAHSSKSGASVHTPYPPRCPLTPDVATPTSNGGDFSTRAYMGSSSGMPMPTPVDFPPVSSLSSSPEGSSGYFPQVSAPLTPLPAPEHEHGYASEGGEGTDDNATLQADVAPLPRVGPFKTLLAPVHVAPPSCVAASNMLPAAASTSPSSTSASSPSTSNSASDSDSSTPSSTSTAPTATSASASPTSSSFKKSPSLGSGLARWASVSLRGKRASAPPPPSAYVSPSSAQGAKAARATLDNPPPTTSPVSATPAPPPTYKLTPMSTEPEATPKRRASLLRGEAKVLSGRVSRDPARVEEGRRMLSEA